MNLAIFNPLEEYEKRLKAGHLTSTTEFFDELVKKSEIDIEKNRATVKEYHKYREQLAKLKKKLFWMRLLRVLMCITLILIPLVILKTTPKIKELRAEIERADNRADELFAEATAQMQPLNSLFTDRDCLELVTKNVPLMKFDTCFSVKQEEDMKINYDFCDFGAGEQSTLDVLAGNYNENPFLFENKLVHTMGEETYHGYKTISWTETYRDSNGKLCTRRVSETLHATVTKPKPFYSTQVVLNYCSQGGPELSFSRDATHLHNLNEKEIKRYIKKGEKRLEKKEDKALKDGKEFTTMANSEFEVLFDALDRTNEVQFRALFTPLAQTNMVDLILSKVGYGDDFNFIKLHRTNRIVSRHSQGRAMQLLPSEYKSFDYDEIRSNFISKNEEFFKAVYFDFAPLLAIPMYQERPVHSLKPIPDYSQLYSLKECEVLANAVSPHQVAHPKSKTQAILKATYVGSRDNTDETCITAFSYDIKKRVDVVVMHGGDGRFHNVNVEWDEYLPLVQENNFYVSTSDSAQNRTIYAKHNNLCIFR